MTRLAGFTTIVAGLVRASASRCPQPFTDPDATGSDVGHWVASIETFGLWTAMPIVMFCESAPGRYRSMSGLLSVWTVAGFVTAGATAHAESNQKGLAQRAFLGGVFASFGTTTFVELARR